MDSDNLKFAHVDSIAIALMVAADDYEAVGSRITSSVYANDADYDFLLLFEDDIPFNLDAKLCSEYECESTAYEGVKFKSYHKDKTNLIITEDKKFYRLFMLATKLATLYDLKTKSERVRLFQAVLYGRDVDNDT